MLGSSARFFISSRRRRNEIRSRTILLRPDRLILANSIVSDVGGLAGGGGADAVWPNFAR
jgi:hypothetical protein